MKTGVQALVAVAAAALLAGTAHGACLDDAQVAALVQAQAEKTPAATPEGLSEADAACTRSKLHALMAQRSVKSSATRRA